ncbi:MAG: hypothetical protein LBV41_08130 [Cytophagaceae bacterium]|jgi:hypothetical protein|nr:hypothetical protein [Cytophagaceae bacterium]
MEKNERLYKCKNEELPIIAAYVLYGIKRDLSDFQAYSPIFDDKYIVDFNRKIIAANELVNPRVEMEDSKAATERLHIGMDALIVPANRLAGYVEFARKEIQITPTGFGITALKKRIKARDAEGVLQNLRLVNANIQKYKTQLEPYGLTQEMIGLFTKGISIISAENQLQYETTENRRATVQANMNILNDLYLQITVICKTGKILYPNNVVKLSEYTFIKLMQKVRSASKEAKKKNDAK